ncbi:MAG TPA: hypothetical protein VFL76_09665 [Edaphocola sp.]|nr:hypothetical protein [Edaphocola sp.]
MIPFGKYGHFFVSPYRVNNKDAVLIIGVRIVHVQDPQQRFIRELSGKSGREQEVIGIYTTDAVKYWQ